MFLSVLFYFLLLKTYYKKMKKRKRSIMFWITIFCFWLTMLCSIKDFFSFIWCIFFKYEISILSDSIVWIISFYKRMRHFIPIYGILSIILVKLGFEMIYERDMTLFLVLNLILQLFLWKNLYFFVVRLFKVL